MNKICNKCKDVKPWEFFGKSKSTKDGLSYTCKECNRKTCNETYRRKVGENNYKRKLKLKSEGKKLCNCCKKILDLDRFNTYSNGERIHSTCDECYKQKNKDYYISKRKLKEDGRIAKQKLLSEGKKKCTICNEIKVLDHFYVNKNLNRIQSKCNDCMVNHRRKIRPPKEFGTAWLMSLRDKGLKRCFKCKEIKLLDSFGFCKNDYDGRQRSCKVCKSKLDKEYRNNPLHRDKLLNRKKIYYEKTKHTERHLKNVQKRKDTRDYKKEYRDVRNDEWRRSKDDLRKLMNACFAKRKEWVKKDSKTHELLGADYFVVKEFIERQFLKGMSWGNHGEWHIDHVIPLDSANKDKDILYRLFYYQNLTPIWKDDNLSKSYKIPKICTLWSNPIVPYKEMDVVIEPKYKGHVGDYKLVIEPGTRYGRFTVIKDSEKSPNGRRMLLCKCDCGIIKDVNCNGLRSGKIRSCGCYHREVIRKKKKITP